MYRTFEVLLLSLLVKQCVFSIEETWIPSPKNACAKYGRNKGQRSQIYKHLLVQFRISWVWTCRDSWIFPFELYVIANLLCCCAYSFAYLIDISAILHCIRWHGNIDCSCVHKGYNVEVRTIHGKRWQFPVHDSS